MGYWTSKVVVVAGGSAGLGRAITGALARGGADIVVLGRNPDRLAAMEDSLSPLPGLVRGVVADLTDPDSVEKVCEELLVRTGRLDAWFNCVGQSTRVSLDQADPAAIRMSLEANLMTAVHGTRAALGALARSGGHLVNIGSLSGKTAWPFMAPYTVSKHALTGWTDQVRLEAPAGVHVMLVCPGPIARQDAGARYDQQAAELPAEAARPGAGAPVRQLDPEWLATRILRDCQRRRPELIVPAKARLLFGLRQWFPRFALWLMDRLR